MPSPIKVPSNNERDQIVASFAMRCEVLLLGMEKQKETAREMAQLARRMSEQALQMKQLPRRAPLP